MLDCTGSMQEYIDIARNRITKIIFDVKKKYPHCEVRIGIVAYRDVNDLKRFQIFHFQASADEARKFLAGLVAKGGEDIPEDVNGAFQKVLSFMNWASPVRLFVHIADAPCHGREFHALDLEDKYPKGYREDIGWNKIFKELVEMRLDYVFMKISACTDKMFEKFQALAERYDSKKYNLTFCQEEMPVIMPTLAEGYRYPEDSSSYEVSKETADTSRAPLSESHRYGETSKSYTSRSLLSTSRRYADTSKSSCKARKERDAQISSEVSKDKKAKISSQESKEKESKNNSEALKKMSSINRRSSDFFSESITRHILSSISKSND